MPRNNDTTTTSTTVAETTTTTTDPAPTTTVQPTTTVAQPTTTVDECLEDEPCWDCETMGNRECGPAPTHTLAPDAEPHPGFDCTAGGTRLCPQPEYTIHTTVGISADPGQTLPATGIDWGGVTLLAVLLVAVGIVAVRLSRRPRPRRRLWDAEDEAHYGEDRG